MSVGQVLKQARESQNLTLKDIYKKTRINEKLLEKIENGIYDFAPKPYIKAFIRSYAKALGLNSEEIVSEFENEVAPPKQPEKVESSKSTSFSFYQSQKNLIWVIIALVLLFAMILIFTEPEKKEEHGIGKNVNIETFEKENQRAEQIENRNFASDHDSLDLKIISTDSVWLNVMIDDTEVKEFLMLPNTTLNLKAKNNFKFIVGNAGGVRFILNGHELESIGKKGVVVRNYVIDREKLKHISQQNHARN